ncbi:CpsD/CapB family tyrosine-protein kinase [Litoreibacter janthinus]|nr:CpsD/CapB family tyrosine-protein kinase [Litoreibacter janthinus]
MDDIRLRILADMVQRNKHGAFVVSFCGAVRRAGTTSITIGVARSFSRATPGKKVLILPFAREGKSVAEMAPNLFGKAAPEAKPANRPTEEGDGEAVVAAKTGPLDDIIHGPDGLDLLPVTGPFEVRRLCEEDPDFWNAVNETYFAVLIDTGLLGSEAMLLASRHVDLNLLVVDGKKMRTAELERLHQRFTAAKIEPDGVILNRRKEYLPRLLRASIE